MTEYSLYEDLLVSPVSIDGEGCIEVPTDPRLGTELTDDLVAEYGIA